MRRSLLAVLPALLLMVLGCSGGDRKSDKAGGTGSRILLLGDNYGGIKIEQLGAVTVTEEIEKPAEVVHVQTREESPRDTFGVTPGTYRAYRLTVGEKRLGRVFSPKELIPGATIKDLRSIGWVRLRGTTDGGVGSMTGMDVLVMEGSLASP